MNDTDSGAQKPGSFRNDRGSGFLVIETREFDKTAEVNLLPPNRSRGMGIRYSRL